VSATQNSTGQARRPSFAEASADKQAQGQAILSFLLNQKKVLGSGSYGVWSSLHRRGFGRAGRSSFMAARFSLLVSGFWLLVAGCSLQFSASRKEQLASDLVELRGGVLGK